MEPLLGLWRLVECKQRFSDTGETADLMGAAPAGLIAFLPGNRVIALLTDTQRTAADDPARLFGGVAAYSGHFTTEGNRFVTDVDLSWHPSWLGTKQVRYFEIDGDELRITSAEQTMPGQGERLGRGFLVWRREHAL